MEKDLDKNIIRDFDQPSLLVLVVIVVAGTKEIHVDQEGKSESVEAEYAATAITSNSYMLHERERRYFYLNCSS